jgi:ubiquinone/menaquinone biosynthesis C-methylase UbiE
MDPALKDKLLQPLWLRRFVRRIFATGDTVRRVVQKPIVDTFLPDRGDRAIDVGVGRGMYTFDSLQPRFRQVVALEIRSDHIAYLADYKKRNGLTNISLVQGSAEHLPFKAGACDTVLCTEVIEHLPSDEQGLQELVRILPSGGQLIISVPVPPAPRYDGAHVHEGYTYHQMKELLDGCSMNIHSWDYCLLWMSRSVLHLIALFENKLGFPPPVLFLCYIERWLFRYRKDLFRPYDIIIKSTKKD